MQAVAHPVALRPVFSDTVKGSTAMSTSVIDILTRRLKELEARRRQMHDQGKTTDAIDVELRIIRQAITEEQRHLAYRSPSEVFGPSIPPGYVPWADGDQ